MTTGFIPIVRCAACGQEVVPSRNGWARHTHRRDVTLKEAAALLGVTPDRNGENEMRTWTTARTETRRWDQVTAGDKVIDPDTGRMMAVWRTEPLAGVIYIDGTLKRNVVRRVWPSQPVEVCIPKEYAR